AADAGGGGADDQLGVETAGFESCDHARRRTRSIAGGGGAVRVAAGSDGSVRAREPAANQPAGISRLGSGGVRIGLSAQRPDRRGDTMSSKMREGQRHVPRFSQIDGAGVTAIVVMSAIFYFAALRPVLDPHEQAAAQ